MDGKRNELALRAILSFYQKLWTVSETNSHYSFAERDLVPAKMFLRRDKERQFHIGITVTSRTETTMTAPLGVLITSGRSCTMYVAEYLWIQCNVIRQHISSTTATLTMSSSCTMRSDTASCDSTT